MYLVIAVVIFVIILVVGWWVLGAANVVSPIPDRPDANFNVLIDDFNSIPRELWFRNNKCIFEEHIKSTTLRYVVLESDGSFVYDSKQSRILPADDIPRTFEYQRSSLTGQGVAKRGKTLNVCELVREGSVSRYVHISQYMYDENDTEY